MKKNRRNELTPKQELFCREYLVDFNATQAAIRAGYSKKAAGQQGAENLKKPNIKRFLAEAQSKRAKRLEISAERVAEELARIGFSNIADVVEWDGNGIRIKDGAAIDGDALRAVSEISENKEGWRKIKMHSKTQALAIIVAHLADLTAQEKPAQINLNFATYDRQEGDPPAKVEDPE